MNRYFDTHRRLLEAAADLFYSAGVKATCIDNVVAKSGISKPTLYTHFRSKEELLAAVLEMKHIERMESLELWIDEKATSQEDGLLVVFDWLHYRYVNDAVRGCAFTNAAAEIADSENLGFKAAQRHKQSFRNFLTELATKADISDPEKLASDLALLIDGSNTRVLLEHDYEIALQAKRVAQTIIDAYRRRALT